jgi:radical SAM family RiPP maturation amino acid epimerase
MVSYGQERHRNDSAHIIARRTPRIMRRAPQIAPDGRKHTSELVPVRRICARLQADERNPQVGAFWLTDAPERDDARTVAHIKCYAELLEGDPQFRAQVASDPALAAAERGLLLSPEAAHYYAASPEQRASLSPPSEAALVDAYFEEKHAHRQRISARANACPDSGFRAWHTRQVNRCEMELGPQTNSSFTHLPFVVELSHGCSVGCHFCALSAQSLDAIFRAREDTMQLFEEVLDVALALFGDAARDAVLYYATEPLDNPDYLRFAQTFAAKMERVPILTTAVALRDCETTRAALLLRAGCDPAMHRFSILSLEQLRNITQTFSPEEMLYVELLPRYEQASMGLVRAGRGRKTLEDALFTTQGTISCITGFIVNLATRTVRLSTPCQTSQSRPDGAFEKELGSFETAQEMEGLISDCIRRMSPSLDLEREVALAPFLRFEPGPPCVLEHAGIARVLPGDDPLTLRVLSLLAHRSSSAAALIGSLEAEGTGSLRTQILLQSLYQKGLLAYIGEDAWSI